MAFFNNFLKNNFVERKLNLAESFLNQDEFFKALAVLRSGVKIAPENLNLRYLLAVTQTKLWKLNLAEKEFEFIRERCHKDPEILRQLGWIKVLKGELKEGRSLLRESISLQTLEPLGYVDLGASYVMSLDFEEGFKWLETGKNLAIESPHKIIIEEKFKEAERLREQMIKFSAKEKKETIRMRNDPEEIKLEAVNNMLSIIKNAELTKKDYEEVQEELKLYGLNPKMFSKRPPETEDEKTIFEYMEYHSKVKDVERKISNAELKQIEGGLYKSQASEDELKKFLIILAHQGTKETIDVLKSYSKKAPEKLKDWLKLVLEECKMHSQAKPGQIVKIIHEK